MARLVFVAVPTGKRDAVIDILEDDGIDYTLTDEVSHRDYTCALQFPLPTNAVEPILEELRDVGVDDDAITVTVETQTIVSHEFDALQDRYAEDDDTPEQIAREELQSAAHDLVPNSLRVYTAMTVVSAIIATAGLLLDSAAVVVGSMVIAPLIGPAMATSVGTVFREHDLFRDGFKLQLAGLLISVISAAVFAFLVKTANVVPPGLDILAIDQIRERFRPDVLSLVVALGSGAAGVISLASGLSSALVGVMIAVALIPPAATVGIGLAWGIPGLILGSGILLLVNVLSINLAALLMLWYMGYRPSQWFRLEETTQIVAKRVGVLIISVLVLTAFLGAVTYTSYRTATVEQAIHTEVESHLNQPALQGYSLLELNVDYSDNLLAQTPSRVTILIGIPTNQPPPDLGDELDDRIDDIAGRDIAVQIRYLPIQNPVIDNPSSPHHMHQHNALAG